MHTNYIHRPIVIIDTPNDCASPIHPNLTVLRIKTHSYSSYNHLDIGAMCYTRRATNQIQHKGFKVDPTSLDENRIPIIKNVIEQLVEKSSVYIANFFNGIKNFMRWLDNQEQKVNLGSPSEMKGAYITYTTYLIHRMQSSETNSKQINMGTAAALQSHARAFISISTEIYPSELASICTCIRENDRKRHVRLSTPSADEQSRTFAVLVNYIEDSHRLLVEGGSLPLRVVSPNDPTYYLYTMVIPPEVPEGKFSMPALLKKSPSFPTWPNVVRHFSLTWTAAATVNEASSYYSQRARYERNNKDLFCSFRQRVGKHTTSAALLAFIAATGCNRSVALSLVIDSIDFVPSTKGMRLSGTKSRAMGKVVTPEFGSRFTPVFKKYLEIREWLLNGYHTDLLFPFLPGKDGLSFNSDAINKFKEHLLKILPNTKWISPTQWRKNLSYHYAKLSSGDTLLTAEKLGNTEEVVRKNYSRPTIEDYATEMTNFLDSVYQAAIARSRNQEVTSVRVINPEEFLPQTALGTCSKEDSDTATYASGFTKFAPTPACDMPETCLFCEHYAVHADAQDVRRLLSLRYVADSMPRHLAPTENKSKHSIIIDRVEDIISAIIKTNGIDSKTIGRIREEIDCGGLDPFWAIHFDTMVAAGILK